MLCAIWMIICGSMLKPNVPAFIDNPQIKSPVAVLDWRSEKWAKQCNGITHEYPCYEYGVDLDIVIIESDPGYEIIVG